MTRTRTECIFCRGKLGDEHFCPNCKQPTELASPVERANFELTEWKTSRSNTWKKPEEIPIRRVIDVRDDPPAPPAVAESGAPAQAASQPAAHRAATRTRAPAKAPSEGGPRLDLVTGESVLLTLEGRSMLRRATLTISNFRVAVVPARGGRVRWIPLNEVSEIGTAWRGEPTLVIEGSFETLRFSHPSQASLENVMEYLVSTVRLARRGAIQHRSSEVLQRWLDQSTRPRRRT